MEQVWETLRASSFSFLGAYCILQGGLFVFWGIRGYYLREKRYFSTAEAKVVLLTAGFALIAIGLLTVLNILRENWTFAACLMIGGLLLLLEGTGILDSPGSKRFSKVGGIVAMLVSAIYALAALNVY